MVAGGIALLICAPGVGAGAPTVLVIKAIGMKAAGGAMLAGGMAGDEYLVKSSRYIVLHMLQVPDN